MGIANLVLEIIAAIAQALEAIFGKTKTATLELLEKRKQPK